MLSFAFLQGPGSTRLIHPWDVGFELQGEIGCLDDLENDILWIATSPVCWIITSSLPMARAPNAGRGTSSSLGVEPLLKGFRFSGGGLFCRIVSASTTGGSWRRFWCEDTRAPTWNWSNTVAEGFILYGFSAYFPFDTMIKKAHLPGKSAARTATDLLWALAVLGQHVPSLCLGSGPVLGLGNKII